MPISFFKRVRNFLVFFFFFNNEPVISFVFSKKLNHFKKDFGGRVMNRPHPHTSKASTLPAELHTYCSTDNSLYFNAPRRDDLFLLFRRGLGWPRGLAI